VIRAQAILAVQSTPGAAAALGWGSFVGVFTQTTDVHEDK